MLFRSLSNKSKLIDNVDFLSMNKSIQFPCVHSYCSYLMVCMYDCSKSSLIFNVKLYVERFTIDLIEMLISMSSLALILANFKKKLKNKMYYYHFTF